MLSAAIVATLGCAALSFQKTAGNVFARRTPDLALRIAPANALALATSADRLFVADPSGNAALAERLATRSLRAQGLNAYAVRVLGYVADIRGQYARAATLMTLSSRLSRRDLGAQMWLIESAVKSGDIRNALQHYDVALRTTGRTAPLLYPILTAALDEQAIRDAFAPYVRDRPFWMEAFLAYAIAKSDHPDRLSALLLDVPEALADPRNRELAKRLTERLLADGWIDEAKRVYLGAADGSPARLVSPALDTRDGAGQDGVMGWRLLSTATVQASVESGPNAAAVLHIEADGDASGRIAQKPLFLPPARYRFTARIASGDRGANTMLRWRLACAVDPRRDVWTRDPQGGDAVVSFVIDPECSMQTLSVDVVEGDRPQGATVDVTRIAIRRD